MMCRKFVANIRFKIAVVALGALPLVLAAVVPAWSQPRVELSPLPWATRSEVRAGQTSHPTDARASELGSRLREVAGRVSNSATAYRVAARSARPASAGPNGTGTRKAVANSSGLVPVPGRTTAKQIVVERPEFNVRMRSGGTVRDLRAATATVLQSAIGTGTAAEERTVRAFLNAQRPLLGLRDPDRELRLGARHSDRLGHRHLKFEQTYEGLPVFGAELIAQLDASGNLITLSGRYAPTPRKLSKQPVVQRTQATDLVRALHGAADGAKVEPTLVVFLRNGVTPHLAWRFDLQAGLFENRLVMIDAHTGSVLADFNQMQSANRAGSGTDLFGTSRSLNVWEEAGAHYMVDTSKAMYDTNSNPPQLTSSNGVIIIQDARNQPPTSDPQIVPALASITSTAATGPWLPAAVSAAANLSVTYDYFASEHSRDSLDGNGSNLIAVVRLGQGFANALFDASTQTMYFGDAAPYAGALDVVAHELTHGVIANSANLLYQNQSGALNEAFADIFAEMVEAKANGQPDWKIGSRLAAPLRNMADPGAVQYAPGAAYPSRMSEYVFTSQDNGGVHLNSSIVNHAFYLLAAGAPNAIGTDAAADIFYRALTTKLTRLSDFTDARFAAIQSAAELFGVSSPQARRTEEAFDAVQIFDTPSNPLPPPFSGTEGADSTIFVYWDGSAGAYHLGRYEPSAGDSSPGVQLTLNPVSGSRPSVSGDGQVAVFVDEQNDLCLISTAAPGSEECLGFPGFVHSVAVSPDAQMFAFVFLDAQGDPINAISVIDIAADRARTFDLVSPNYDGTLSVEVISADALDFTADGRFAIYDAFNAMTFTDGSRLGLWSIYAIDLTTEATLAVLPPTLDAEGNPLNIAFPAIAQTSDDHMTFDVLDEEAGQNFVLAGDLLTGALAVVGVSSTYATPGYTGDDAAIVYSVSDAGTPTRFSLRRQAISNRLTPVNASTAWLKDADYGVIYRRGDYAGPSHVDLAVSQSSTTQSGHRAVFSVKVTNLGPDAASDMQLTDTLPANVNLIGTQTTGTCRMLASAHQLSCTLPALQPNVTETVSITVEARSAGSLTNSMTAFASEPDTDASDNTSFTTVGAARLNTAPVAQMQIGSRTAQVGTAFSLAVSANFGDADNDVLSFSATGLPTGLTMAAAGTVSGTPGSGSDRAVAYVVDVTATDSFGATARTSFTLTVNAAATPPPPPSSGGGGGGGGSIDLATLLSLLLLGSTVGARRSRRATAGVSKCSTRHA